MKRFFFAATLSALCVLSAAAASYGDYPIQGVPFSHVRLSDAFWLPRIQQNQQTTIPIALGQCYDTGRVLNFQKAAAILEGRNIGWFATDYTFDDTDIYKILEGMSYSYQTLPTQEIRAKMDTLVAIVAAAQEPDGYLYTARTAGEPGHYHDWVGPQRWEWDPIDSHELYNSGHLFEAAAAHFTATGDSALLRVAQRNADLLAEKFLRGGLAYEPGHQIVEMGLVKLYRATGREDYLRLAKYFLDIRGVGGPNSQQDEYHQSHMPPREQRKAVGHAVRATYMYSGMADVAAIMDEQDYRQATDALWQDVAETKLYITGGIGARHSGEAFGESYELPNASAYNETCAAIANVYWNYRMFLTTGESRYIDILERTLYNGVLSGISLSGDHFFYPNPLESTGGYTRSEWFGCACCPSNLCRFIPSVPGYIYATDADGLYVNLYAQGSADITMPAGRLALTMQSGYPWAFDNTLTLDSLDAAADFIIRLRLPHWATTSPVPGGLYSYIDEPQAQPEVLINGAPADYTIAKGYIELRRQWQAGDKIKLSMPMRVRQITTAKIAEDRGHVALERGPIVYCLEQEDNGTDMANIIVEPTARITANPSTELTVPGETSAMLLRINAKEAYTSADTVATRGKTVKAIPYYAWDNRSAGAMRVWIAAAKNATEAGSGIVAVADTLDIDVAQADDCAAYATRPAYIDRVAAARTLGITTDQLASLYGQAITYAAILPNGQADANSTANAPGHWFAADGTIANWGAGSVLFSEYQPQARYFNVGYYPGAVSRSQTFTIMQALTMAGADDAAEGTRRVVIRIHLHIGTAADVRSYAAAQAQAFLDSPYYANITGSLRQDLTAAIATGETEDIDRATLAFLDAQTADAIASHTAGRPAEDGTIYNLAGQRLRQAPKHGVYLRGGKKIVR